MSHFKTFQYYLFDPLNTDVTSSAHNKNFSTISRDKKRPLL